MHALHLRCVKCSLFRQDVRWVALSTLWEYMRVLSHPQFNSTPPPLRRRRTVESPFSTNFSRTHSKIAAIMMMERQKEEKKRNNQWECENKRGAWIYSRTSFHSNTCTHLMWCRKGYNNFFLLLLLLLITFFVEFCVWELSLIAFRIIEIYNT